MHQHSSAIQDSENQSQNTVQQQKGQQKSQANHPKSIQAKQKTLQRKVKPPIQAKHKPVQAKQSPVQRNQGGKAIAQGSAQFKEIATTMGEQHGVDTSPLKATHNSSFPQTVNAAATIQGNKIDFAPGEDTTANMKHEVAHYIDNTKNGTPQGDKVVNGQKVDTTREKVVDKMAEGTLQRKEAESLETPKTTQPIIQRLVLVENNEAPNAAVNTDGKVFTQNHINYAVQTSGGPIVHYNNIQQGQWAAGALHIVEHGGPGNINGRTAAQVAADIITLATPANQQQPAPPANQEIRMTSCFSGSQPQLNAQAAQAVVPQPQSLIQGVRGILGNDFQNNPIIGYDGPTITQHDGNNAIFQVVDPADLPVAGVVQDVLLGLQNVPAPPNPAQNPPGFTDLTQNQLFTLQGIMLGNGQQRVYNNLVGDVNQAIQTWKNNHNGQDPSEVRRAAIIAGVSTQFYTDFVNILQQLGVNLGQQGIQV